MQSNYKQSLKDQGLSPFSGFEKRRVEKWSGADRGRDVIGVTICHPIKPEEAQELI